MTDALSWSLSWPHTAIALVFGYLLGSIPFGLVTTRLFGLGNIREIGSGNIGATNVLRTGNKVVAALTLLGDMLKGTLAVLVASEWSTEAAMAAGFAAFMGHLFPVWLRFEGGKGVATFLGVLLGLNFFAALAFSAIWLGVAAISRFSSLAALVASASTPVVLIGLDQTRLAALFAVLSVFILIKHQPNLERLLNGTEAKINFKSKGPSG